MTYTTYKLKKADRGITKYVSIDGDDIKGNGSFENPFLTLKKTLDSIPSNAPSNSVHYTVKMANGYYLEPASLELRGNINIDGGIGDNDVIIQKDDFSPVVLSPPDIGDEIRVTIRGITFPDGFTRSRPTGSVDFCYTQLERVTTLGPTTFTGVGVGNLSEVDSLTNCQILTTQHNCHSVQIGYKGCNMLRLNVNDVGVDGTDPSSVGIDSTSHTRLDVTDSASVSLRTSPFQGPTSIHLDSATCAVSADETSNPTGTNVFAGGATAAQITKPPIGQDGNEELLNAANWTTAIPADATEALNRLVADFVVLKGSSIT